MNPRFLFVTLAVISMGLGPKAYTETAASMSVTTTEDRVDVDGCTRSDCTLREAILAANAIGRGTIHIELMEGTYTLTLPNAVTEGEDEGATGDLDLRNDIELVRSPDANPSTPTIIEGSRGLADRVIDIVAPRPTPDTTRLIRVLIQGVTIRNGSLGGLRVGFDATLDMTDSRIEKNEGLFGGLVNAGTCSLRRVIIDRNRTISPIGGGGVINGGSLTLNQVAITNNTGLIGGGLTNYIGGTASLVNVTISGNRATGFGGGIANIAALNLQNVTISGNTADSDEDRTGHGGGLINYPPSGAVTPVVTIRNTIIAGNTDNNPDPSMSDGIVIPQTPDCSGSLTSHGHNIIQDQRGCAGLIASDTNGNPQLMALGDNGGPTQTHALGSGSAALNAGDRAACQPVDQRERSRRNGFCDIGAYEAQPATIAVDAGAGQSARSGAAFGTSLRVRVRDAAGNPLAGVDVAFTAPASGASASLSVGRATTNAEGIASMNATANSTAGAYTVTATIDGTTTSAGLSLTNTAGEGAPPPPPPAAPPSVDPAPATPTPEVGESDEPEAPASPVGGGGGCGCQMGPTTNHPFNNLLLAILMMAPMIALRTRCQASAEASKK